MANDVRKKTQCPASDKGFTSLSASEEKYQALKHAVMLHFILCCMLDFQTEAFQ